MNAKNAALLWLIIIGVYAAICPCKVFANYKPASRLVAHAFGGYNGATYTNSKEAFLYNYNKGHRVFEVDFQFTEDNILATIHDRPGGKIYSFENEQRSKRYTIMTFEDVCRLMLDYPDIYIITDTKYFEDMEATKKTFDYMTKTISSIDPKLKERIIIQFYNQAMYYFMIDRYDFESYIYTLYSSSDTDAQVIDFIKETGVSAVTMWASRATAVFVKSLNELNATVFAHTVNVLEYSNKLIANGVYGIYTDFLIPSDMILSDAELNKRYFYDYLSNLDEKSTYIVYISGEDAAVLPENIQQAFNELGIPLPQNTDDVSISIVENMKPASIQTASKELNIEYFSNETLLNAAYSINNNETTLSLSANGIDYKVNKKGITIYVYNSLSKTLVDSFTINTDTDFAKEKNDFTLIIRQKYLLDYLDSLMNEDYIAVLSVADEASLAINDTIQQKLKSLGLNEILQDKYWYSYAAILDSSKVVYEKLSKTKISYSTNINDYQITVGSAGYPSGNYSTIKLGNNEYSLNYRGINIVIFDKATGKKISSVCFDTHEGLRCYK